MGHSSAPNLIVGLEHPDDAAVLRLPSGEHLVQSVDVIAPIANDPAVFGRIACANALSDVYAMGGRPITAMNVAFFPSKTLPLSILKTMMEGALETLKEASCLLVGGHTVDDPELKMGFSVTGLIEEGPVFSIDRANANDRLILTKPLGTGVVNQALRKDKITDESSVYLEAQTSMTTLNAAGAQAAKGSGASAMTDVTGFGLLGHATQFARASKVTFEIEASAVPAFDGVPELIASGIMAGRSKVNRQAYQDQIAGLTDEMTGLLFDPQTSGGLLIAISEDKVERCLEALSTGPTSGQVIGRAIEKRDTDIVVR